MSNLCPQCGAPIAPGDLNMQEGVGLCRACGALSRLGQIADASGGGVTASGPAPQGCRIDDQGSRITVRASVRSASGAAGAAFVCLFWNGIVSVFVLLAIAGLYTNLIGPLPAWFPAPGGSTGGTGQNGGLGPNMGLGMTLFLCIFLMPFVGVGLAMLGAFILCAAGEVQVRLDGARGSVWTGVGSIGWNRRFDASAVKRVAIGRTSWTQNEQHKPLVEIEADRKVRFGTLLSEERREWLVGALRELLVAKGGRR